MTTDLRIIANGFAALKQQADEVSRQNQQSATTKEQNAKTKTALQDTQAVKSAIAEGADPMRAQEQYAAGGSTWGGRSSQSAPAKDSKDTSNPKSGNRRNDVPSTSLNRELAANGGPSESLLGVEWRIEFSPLDSTPMDNIDETETMTLTVGPPGHAATASVVIPNSRRTVRVPSYFDLKITEDRILLLPLGDYSCIFVYHRNFLRSIDFVNIGGSKDSLEVHETYAFVVNKTGARLLATPSALKANLDDIYPPVTVNATRVQCLFAGPGGVCLSSVTVDHFNQLLWADGSRYGRAIVYSTTSAIGRASVLALQYGILNVDAANSFDFYKEYQNYFTPAVFRFIKGSMTLDADALNYEHMRSNYFPQAPRYFLKRCVLDGTCTELKTGFDLTRIQPATLDTVLAPADFKPAPKLDVLFNGYELTGSWQFSFGAVRYPGLVFGWDWANAGFCRQQAVSLGFSGADLRP